MSNIDPTDVPPASNLPGPSVAWGRNRDAHILDLEKKVISLEQAQAGANRNTAASLASISKQIAALTAPIVFAKTVTGTSLVVGTEPATSAIMSATVTVPAGYTKAFVTMSTYFYYPSAHGVAIDRFTNSLYINSTRVAFVYDDGDFTTGPNLNLWGSGSLGLSGLTAGATITAAIWADAMTGFTPRAGATATINGFALFYN